MAIGIGLFSAACFGLNMVLIRMGMKSSPKDDGHFMSVITNVAILGITLVVVGVRAWQVEGVVAFVVAGALTTFLGRGLSLRAIRLIGPARSAAFLMAAPLVAAIGGVVFLNETVSPQQALGGLVVLVGLGLLVAGKMEVEPLVPAARETQTVGAKEGWAKKRGYVFSGLAVLSFGSGFVVSKWGTNVFPSPIAAAFVGALTAFVLITSHAITSHEFGRLLRDNVRHVHLWFLLGGALTAVGLLTRYWAFLSLPAWIVSVLTGTQALWTVFWSYLLLNNEEFLTKQVLGAVFLVTVGVAVLAQAQL